MPAGSFSTRSSEQAGLAGAGSSGGSKRGSLNPVRHGDCCPESRTGFSLSCPVMTAHLSPTRIGRRRQKSPSRCIFSADDLRSCRPQKVENADARRASADRLLTGDFTQIHGILPLFAWQPPVAGANPALRAWQKVGQASACHALRTAIAVPNRIGTCTLTLPDR